MLGGTISATTSAYKSEGRSISPASDSQPDLVRSASKEDDSSTSPSSSRKHNGTLFGMIRRTSQNVGTSFAASVGAYLPSAVSEMWEPARDFAWLKIPKSPPFFPASQQAGGGGGAFGTPNPAATTSTTASTAPLRSVVAMSGNSPQVLVVTNEGHFYVFGIDLEKGGEGTLLKVYEVGAESERLGE